MKQKELTKTFIIILNLTEKPFSLHGLNKNNTALQGMNRVMTVTFE